MPEAKLERTFHRNDPDESHAVSGVECYTHRGGTSCSW